VNSILKINTKLNFRIQIPIESFNTAENIQFYQITVWFRIPVANFHN
jgi:hypothetical protein